MIVRADALDVGFSPVLVAFVLAFWVIALAVGAVAAAAVAVAIVGPRRWDAVAWPATAVFVAGVAAVVLAEVWDWTTPWLVVVVIGIGTLTAIATALWQRGDIEDPDDPGVSGRAVLRSAAIGTAIGALLGAVVTFAAQSVVGFAICLPIGLVLGLRAGLVDQLPPAPTAASTRQPPADAVPPAGMLDE